MKYVYLFIISMAPFVELRGAIIWATAINLNIFLSSIICILGNIVVMPIIFVYAKKILIYGTKYKYIGPIFNKILNKGKETGEKLLSKSSKKVYIALLLFIGIPLPGTGVWTGTLGASMLNLDLKKSFLASLGGTIMSCIIMVIISKIGINIVYLLGNILN